MAGRATKSIRLLDDATIDRIAAGEVIERPASVVKELVENSLDSGARHVRIEITDGGMTGIGIEDDGGGIPFRELPLAIERHATSKIASAADILQIGTFGFRGEALASIAAVSRLQIVSRTADEDVGGQITVVGGEIERREPAPRNRGTTVLVEDLFFNTPARRKYLSTAAAEKRAVVSVITTLSLAHPEIRWLLRADGETILELLPVADLPSRARDILGATIAGHLSRFEMEEGGLSVGGLASMPTWTRGNRTQQYVFANRRPIRSPALLQAIAQAYREVIPAGRHPVVILFLQVPLGEIDVNVHPAKSEVRLLLERRAFSLVRRAIQEGLSLKPGDAAAAGDVHDMPAPGGSDSGSGALAGLAAAEADYLRRHFQGDTAQPPAPGMTDDSQSELFGVRSPASLDSNRLAAGSAATESRSPAAFWQLHRTYICTQIRGSLVIIDQHNSHERILYNEATLAMEQKGSVPTQQLLFPAHLDLSPEQVQAYQQFGSELEAIGFTIQPFGGRSLLVQGIPASLKHWAEGKLLLDILDDLTSGGASSDASRKALLASYACHGAIRAGELLSVAEMQSLVDQLFATDLPLSCPHGRPTVIQFTLAELEQRFGRR